jgi:SAM-dependent methyltransferase
MNDVAPDGSPVLLYARLPALGEPELIHQAVPAGAAILELGAGAGRITHGLLALGHEVVAVDNSSAMLAFVRGAKTVLADLVTLDLGRRFPVVVLASNFINEPDAGTRRAYLESCARHVLPDGQVLLQGFPRDWAPSTGWSEHGGVRIRLGRFEQNGDLVSGEMEYLVDGHRLSHAFVSKLLSEKEMAADLHAVGLQLNRELDGRGAWREAVPVGPS